MTFEFNLDAVSTTEFGVGRDGDEGPVFGVVPVDAGVQSALLSMAQATMDRMAADEDGPAEYEPAEKHGSTEYLVVPTGGTLDAVIRQLHDAENLPIDGAHLSNPETVFCYFVRFTDDRDRRLTAIRRATQFKGVLKSKLLRFDDDTLTRLIRETTRLSPDFEHAGGGVQRLCGAGV